LLSGGNIDMKQHHRIISGEDVDVTLGARLNMGDIKILTEADCAAS
jgi:hypothetical protein